MAVDRGKPPKFGFTNLTLIVEDKNDNTPKCGKDLHSANMAEDSPTGQLILCMAVSDSDLAENAKLEFSMSVEDTLFQIDKRTGCIFSNVSKPFDYEAQSVYSFNVTVSFSRNFNFALPNLFRSLIWASPNYRQHAPLKST
jgi:hypothetical protein